MAPEENPLMPAPRPDTPSRRAKDNERPLVEDIRLLGRILGDVIREQEGVEAYELVERIRKLSVAFRRDADHDADKALKGLLKVLTGEPMRPWVRRGPWFRRARPATGRCRVRHPGCSCAGLQWDGQ